MAAIPQIRSLVSVGVTVGITSQQLYGTKGTRIHFSIQNNGANDIFIHFGPGPATILNGIKVIPGVTGPFIEPFDPGRGEIYAIADGGTSVCVVTEG